MVVDLARWLSEQLDVDEELTRAASVKLGDVEWLVSGDLERPGERYAIRSEPTCRAVARVQRIDGDDGERAGVLDGHAVAAHIAAHDPARVLRDIEAKRQLLREYKLADREAKYPDFMGGYSTGLEYAVQLVAAEYADRPGYDPEWAPRSQWGPPGGE